MAAVNHGLVPCQTKIRLLRCQITGRRPRSYTDGSEIFSLLARLLNLPSPDACKGWVAADGSERRGGPGGRADAAAGISGLTAWRLARPAGGFADELLRPQPVPDTRANAPAAAALPRPHQADGVGDQAGECRQAQGPGIER